MVFFDKKRSYTKRMTLVAVFFSVCYLISAHYFEWPEYYFLLDLIVSCTLGAVLYYIENRYISRKIKAHLYFVKK